MFGIFDNGVRVYTENLLKEAGGSRSKQVLEHWRSRIRDDKDLRFPHRKILQALMEEYDFSTGEFRPVHFSRLVREARVGKNMAKSYLSLLQEKGIVAMHDDGYRKWFRIRADT